MQAIDSEVHEARGNALAHRSVLAGGERTGDMLTCTMALWLSVSARNTPSCLVSIAASHSPSTAQNGRFHRRRRQLHPIMLGIMFAWNQSWGGPVEKVLI